MVKISNAFTQGRRKFLSAKLAVAKVLKEAKEKHISYKHLSQIATAAANINKRHPQAHAYWTRLGKVARYLGHRGEGKADYSLKYPEEQEKKYASEAKPALRQLKLQVS